MRPIRLAVPLLLVLSGCGILDFGEEQDPWRGEETAACFARGQVVTSAFIELVDDIEGRGTCGIERPLDVSALVDGSIQLAPSATLGCPMVERLQTWLAGSIQPAAYARFGAPVTTLNNFGAYNCRTRNSRPGAELSEHSFGNAFDVSGFTLADGRKITVEEGWRGSEPERAFLREAHYTACQNFRTVLGPGSDGAHEDHFHLDLLRHDSRGERGYCRPTPVLPAPAVVPTPLDPGVPVATLAAPHPFSVEAVDAARATAQPVMRQPMPARTTVSATTEELPPAWTAPALPAKTYPAPAGLGPAVLGQVPASPLTFAPPPWAPEATFRPATAPSGAAPMSFAPTGD